MNQKFMLLNPQEKKLLKNGPRIPAYDATPFEKGMYKIECKKYSELKKQEMAVSIHNFKEEQEELLGKLKSAHEELYPDMNKPLENPIELRLSSNNPSYRSQIENMFDEIKLKAEIYEKITEYEHLAPWKEDIAEKILDFKKNYQVQFPDSDEIAPSLIGTLEEIEKNRIIDKKLSEFNEKIKNKMNKDTEE